MREALHAARLTLALAAALAARPALGAPRCWGFPTGAVLAFGTYSPFAGNRDTWVDLTYTCNGRAPVYITVSAGNSGNYADRYMLNGAAQLHYNLFTPATPLYGTVWGDGAAGYNSPGDALSVRIYGRIPGGQNAPPSATPYVDGPLVITYSF